MIHEEVSVIIEKGNYWRITNLMDVPNFMDQLIGNGYRFTSNHEDIYAEVYGWIDKIELADDPFEQLVVFIRLNGKVHFSLASDYTLTEREGE